MADPKLPAEARDRWVEIWSRADSTLGTEVKVGMEALKAGAKLKDAVTGRCDVFSLRVAEPDRVLLVGVEIMRAPLMTMLLGVQAS